MLEAILEHHQDDELLLADGFDNAIIGISNDFE